MTKPENCAAFVIRASTLIRHSGFIILVFLAVGCSSNKKPTTRPAGAYDRQEAALRDPFGYSPTRGSDDLDISGGKVGEYNRDAMKKDIDHVLNP